MAITCCVCKKNQSGWIIDYPLSNQLNDYRLCVTCNDVITKISNAQVNDDLSSEIAYLKSFNIDEDTVKKFVEELIFRTENRVDDSFNESLVEAAAEKIKQEMLEKIKSIMLTSGYNFEKHNIIKYLDFISSEVAIGLGFFKSIFASISDTFGTESTSLKNKLVDVKETAFTEFKKQAVNLGANAVIGVDLDYTMFGGSIVAVIISGTAVIVEPETVANDN